jgi:DNA-3-methyladenine glycosylase I
MQHTDVDYAEVFYQIEETLRNQSTLMREEFDRRFGKFSDGGYRVKTDHDIFRVLVYIPFYSGMRSSTVTQKLPTIKKYLYDFNKVKDYSEAEVDQMLRDPNMIRHRRKIEACIANAREFDALLKQHGSFSKYLESFGCLTEEATIKKLRADLTDRFRYLGEITSYHFLTELGLDVIKPDRVICRVFERLGLIDDRKNIDQAVEVGRRIAVATGYPTRYVDAVLVKYGQVGGGKKANILG